MNGRRPGVGFKVPKGIRTLLVWSLIAIQLLPSFSYAQTVPQIPNVPSAIDLYSSDSPVTISPGSPSVASVNEVSFSHLVPGRDFDPRTQLGASIYLMQNPKRAVSRWFKVHNEFVEKVLNPLYVELGDTAEQDLVRRIKDDRETFEHNVPGLGKAELTVVDEMLVVRVTDEMTQLSVGFYDEDRLDEYSDHYKKFVARQNIMAGTSRSDGVRGRHHLAIMVKNYGRPGEQSEVARSHLYPIPQRNLGEGQYVVPAQRDSDNPMELSVSSEAQKANRKAYWKKVREAFKHKIKGHDISFGLITSTIQGAIAAGVELLKKGEVHGATAGLSFGFSMAISTNADPYIDFLGLGKPGFLQVKHGHELSDGFKEKLQSIDWKETMTSRVARSSLISITFAAAYMGLIQTAPGGELHGLSVFDPHGFFKLFGAFVQSTLLIGAPSLLMNNLFKTWVQMPAYIRERANLNTGYYEFNIFGKEIRLPWRKKLIEQQIFTYNIAFLAKLVHLAQVALPASMLAVLGAVGISPDLAHDLGINSGMAMMLVGALFARYYSVRMAMGYEKDGQLPQGEAWAYLGSFMKTLGGRAIFRMERLVRKMRVAYSSWRIGKDNVDEALEAAQSLEEAEKNIDDLVGLDKRDLRNLHRALNILKQQDTIADIDNALAYHQEHKRLVTLRRDLRRRLLNQVDEDDQELNSYLNQSINTLVRLLGRLIFSLEFGNKMQEAESIQDERGLERMVTTLRRMKTEGNGAEEDLVRLLEETSVAQLPTLSQALYLASKGLEANVDALEVIEDPMEALMLDLETLFEPLKSTGDSTFISYVRELRESSNSRGFNFQRFYEENGGELDAREALKPFLSDECVRALDSDAA